MPGHNARWPRHATWLPPIAWMMCIYLVSASHTVPLSYQSMLDLVGDKLLHAAVYALLAWLLVVPLLLNTSLSRSLVPLAAFALAALYGASDEWHQSFVPGRQAEFADWLADAAGAVLAAGCSWLVLRLQQPHRM